MNNTGVTGQFLPPKTDFEHACTLFRLRILGHDRHTYRHTEISIEHPSVGLTSLAQLVNFHGVGYFLIEVLNST